MQGSRLTPASQQREVYISQPSCSKKEIIHYSIDDFYLKTTFQEIVDLCDTFQDAQITEFWNRKNLVHLKQKRVTNKN